MYPYYRDYLWREGRPIGVGKITREASLSYRIVTDPYNKWVSIEMYREGKFTTLIYDSRLLDFRRLKPAEQRAWRKETIDQGEAWIYNEDDRLILREKYTSSSCLVHSPHGVVLCSYALFPEEALVILYDADAHPVMVQHYRTYDRGEFIDLKCEEWSPTAEYASAQKLPG